MEAFDPANEVASDAPTDENPEFDPDSMLDPPIQNVGDEEEVTYDKKVKKIIMEVGEGVQKPSRNYLATIIYKAYFFDHTEFDSSNDQPITLSLGDIAWPEGLWKGIERMRKNEKAKIRIQKKYGFGRKENVDKLKFPKGYEEGEKRELLLKKGVIYEVKLLDWVERVDIEADGNFLKTFIQKADNKEYEKPTERDEITYSMKIFQDPTKILIEKNNCSTNMLDEELTVTLRKILESMKRSEKASIEVSNEFIKENDEKLLQTMGDGYDQSKNLTIEIELSGLIKVEDWYKDGSTLKRILKKGKGSSPNIDSTVKVMLKITVNDKVVVNNFPKDPLEYVNSLSEEEKKTLEGDPNLFQFNLDEYKLPSLMTKILKSMKKHEVCEVVTTKIDKLKNSFANHIFDQHKIFNDGDKVSIFIGLFYISKDEYFYQMTVQRKLQRVLYLKNIAGNFFKIGNYQKAAKIYQKINGYYNFGDATNNYQKEDEESEEFKEQNKELLALKLICFLNLVVCKHKRKEYSSVINITDQIIEMDPNNVKCLYFRGLAFLELQEYENSVNCLTKLCQVDPNHTDGRNALAKAKKTRKDFLDDQHKKYSKMFS